MGVSSIITFLSPSLENYWGAWASPAPPLATALSCVGWQDLVSCSVQLCKDLLVLLFVFVVQQVLSTTSASQPFVRQALVEMESKLRSFTVS